MNTSRCSAIALAAILVIPGVSLTGTATARATTTGTTMASSASSSSRSFRPTARLLVSGLQGASGSTIGPDGALYVTEGAIGTISRVDPKTGFKTTFASGLPPAIVGLGGAIDVEFLGGRAYVLVTLVGPDFLSSDKVGIYRVDGPNTFAVVADIGTFSVATPPPRPFQIDVPSGLQFALDAYRGGFLVTDGHLNRVLWVTLDGRIAEAIGFDNIVPTGLAIWGPLVFMAQAGPVPHLPEDGKVSLLLPRWPFALEIASGAPLLVDVEFGRGPNLYALSQGEFPIDGAPAAPALPNTGALVKVNRNGTLSVVKGGLNLPTSLEFIGDTAYVVNLLGEIWKIELGRHHR
jgi:hypothetical protein